MAKAKLEIKEPLIFEIEIKELPEFINTQDKIKHFLTLELFKSLQKELEGNVTIF